MQELRCSGMIPLRQDLPQEHRGSRSDRITRPSMPRMRWRIRILYTIITRNYRTRYGEIDIISKCNSTLVFTECKYRSSSKFGDPLEAVNLHKQQKICHTAMNFCVKYGYVNYPCRFDVIAIYKDGTINI